MDYIRTDADGKTQLGTGLVVAVTTLCLLGGIAAGATGSHYVAKDKAHLPEIPASSAFMLYLLALAGGAAIGAVVMSTTMSSAPQLSA